MESSAFEPRCCKSLPPLPKQLLALRNRASKRHITFRVTFHEESRPVSIVPSFKEHRFLSSIMEIPAVISSLVCMSSSSVNYTFLSPEPHESRCNEILSLDRSRPRHSYLDRYVSTIDTYIYTYTFKEKENQIVTPDAYTHFLTFRFGRITSGIHATEFSFFLF